VDFLPDGVQRLANEMVNDAANVVRRFGADYVKLCPVLFGMDVNDNLRGWDDDMIAGSVHPIELFEFFYRLRKNNWDGVWQLDQFPFREDSLAAAKSAISFLKMIERALDKLDFAAMQDTQDRQRR
jgi:hypothetical protein